MEKEQVVFWLIVTLAITEPGMSFMFKRNKASDDEDSVAHLKRRYWNDDIQPCIERYCLPYQGKAVYIKCLQHFCPSGLLAVPRDLDAASLLPVAMILGDTKFCADDFVDVGETKSTSTVVGTDALPIGFDDGLRAFQYGLFELCRSSLCADARGPAYDDCVRERCCGRPRRSAATDARRSTGRGRRSSTDRSVDDAETSWTRKRRVNDEVTQCIQSYCSGKQSHDRLVCIVKNCNRA